MYELLKKDWGYKIAAIILAILLWFYVTNLQNPSTEKTINVPVAYLNLEEGLVIGGKIDNIDVKVKGTHSVITTLTEQDIKATVDMSQADLGEAPFIIDLGLPTGVELVQIKQGQSLKLQIDAVTMKQLAIEVQTANAVAIGYSSYIPEIYPSRVVVRGAQQLLDSLEKAQIIIDLNQATGNLILNSPVVLLDKEGKKVSTELLEISPNTVQVTVPVLQNIPTKTVPIKVVLIGQPKAQWQVYRIVLDPETVKITGVYDKLESIDHVMTQPIDITGLQEDLITQVALISPEGVSMVYEPAVKVVVQLEEAPVTRTFEGVPIEALNKPDGMIVQIKPDLVKLTIQGSPDGIESLQNSIRAVVDLADKQPGTYQMEVKIELPNNYHLTKVEPIKVEVVISKN